MDTHRNHEGVCVCIPTDNEKRIMLGHFGDAKYYLHYVRLGGSWILKRKVVNPYTGMHEHEEEESGKRKSMYEMNRECNLLVAIAFGLGGQEYMEKLGMKVIKLSPKSTVEDALKAAESFLSSSFNKE